MSDNLSRLSYRMGVRGGVFSELLASHEKSTTPEPEALGELSRRSHFGTANLLGAKSFYDYLRPEEAQVQVRVCSGTCCELAATQSALKDQLLEHYKSHQIGHAKCLGRCYENHAFQVGDHVYSGASGLTDWQGSRISTKKMNVGGVGTQLLTDSPWDSLTATAFLKKVWAQNPKTLLHEIEKSGLRGRGGAGFPLAKKLATCATQTSPIKFVVMNADEGDPGAYSDRYLLEEQTYRVLAGLGATAHVIGAQTAIVYIRAEYPEAFSQVTKAMTELEKQIPQIEWIAVRGAGSYVCGEETALLASLEGQRPEVRVRPPYPVEQGLFLKPTVVSNVETLTCLPGILEKGGAFFAELGTAASSGTKLVCLDSAFKRPGLYEVPMGTPLTEIFENLGGGHRSAVKAYQLGGPLGGIIPMDKIKGLTLDFESLHGAGFLLGHASVVSIPESFPMIEYLKHLFSFVADESCGKCYPCRIGSFRGKELLENAESKQQPIDDLLFHDLLETLELGSLCQLGGGLPLPIRNALQYFSGELKPFFKGGLK